MRPDRSRSPARFQVQTRGIRPNLASRQGETPIGKAQNPRRGSGCGQRILNAASLRSCARRRRSGRRHIKPSAEPLAVRRMKTPGAGLPPTASPRDSRARCAGTSSAPDPATEGVGTARTPPHCSTIMPSEAISIAAVPAHPTSIGSAPHSVHALAPARLRMEALCAIDAVAHAPSSNMRRQLNGRSTRPNWRSAWRDHGLLGCWWTG